MGGSQTKMNSKSRYVLEKQFLFNYPKNAFSGLNERRSILPTSHFKPQSRSSLPPFQRKIQQTHIGKMLWTRLQHSRQGAMPVLQTSRPKQQNHVELVVSVFPSDPSLKFPRLLTPAAHMSSLARCWPRRERGSGQALWITNSNSMLPPATASAPSTVRCLNPSSDTGKY